MITLSNRIIDETKFIVLYTLMFIFMFRHCAIFITSYMCAADTYLIYLHMCELNIQKSICIYYNIYNTQYFIDQKSICLISKYTFIFFYFKWDISYPSPIFRSRAAIKIVINIILCRANNQTEIVFIIFFLIANTNLITHIHKYAVSTSETASSSRTSSH